MLRIDMDFLERNGWLTSVEIGRRVAWASAVLLALILGRRRRC